MINKLRNNPNLPGLNYEKIHNAVDDKICSVRIDDIPGIVVRQKKAGYIYYSGLIIMIKRMSGLAGKNVKSTRLLAVFRF